jgi:hypothetical protein
MDLILPFVESGWQRRYSTHRKVVQEVVALTDWTAQWNVTKLGQLIEKVPNEWDIVRIS